MNNKLKLKKIYRLFWNRNKIVRIMERNQLLTSVDEVKIPEKAGRIRRGSLCVELQNKRRSWTVENLRDVTQIPAKYTGPRGILGNTGGLQM